MSFAKPKEPHPLLVRLAGRRVVLGWTYAQVAEKAGVSSATAFRTLTGVGSPLFETVAAVAEAMGMPLVMAIVPVKDNAGGVNR